MNKTRLTQNSTEEEIASVLDDTRSGRLSRNLLVELLSERHDVYTNRPSYAANRIRGYALASFADAGLPDLAINFALDELQNGRDAYTVAAAARALRGCRRPKAEYAGFLIQAVHNLRYHDDSLDLTIYEPTWPLQHPSGGRLEIFYTLQWLRGYAKAILPELKAFLSNTIDFTPGMQTEIQKAINAIEADDRELDLSCCDAEGKTACHNSWSSQRRPAIKNIANLEVENEDGVSTPLADVISEKPTAVAFFYTRCMNPNKCTLTLNKIGWLQNELLKEGLESKVNILAFTYDPAYDTPIKMRTFGENRGIVFGSNVHVLRTRPQDFAILSDFFQLGVNHVSSTVNQHRLELYLLDQNGYIRTTYTRLQWEVEKVAHDLNELVAQSSKRNWLPKITNAVQQVIFPFFVAFFPKCPVCWAAYLSAFGLSSIWRIPYSPWLAPLIMLIMFFNLTILYLNSKARNGLVPFWISLTGVLLVSSVYLLSFRILVIPGITLIFIGAILNSLSSAYWSKFCYLTVSLFQKLKNHIPINRQSY